TKSGDLIARHEDGLAFAAQLERDVLGLQLGDDRRGVFEGQVAVERGHLRAGGAHDQEGEKAQHEHGHNRHGGDTGRPETYDELRYIIQVAPDVALSVTIASPRSHPLGKNYPSDGKQVLNCPSQNAKNRQEVPSSVKEART